MVLYSLWTCLLLAILIQPRWSLPFSFPSMLLRIWRFWFSLWMWSGIRCIPCQRWISGLSSRSMTSKGMSTSTFWRACQQVWGNSVDSWSCTVRMPFTILSTCVQKILCNTRTSNRQWRWYARSLASSYHPNVSIVPWMLFWSYRHRSSQVQASSRSCLHRSSKKPTSHQLFQF